MFSPQAIQELLEFSRLSASMKRAASPESRFSSRSPSPTFSSGRTSPAVSSVSGIVTRLKSSSLLPGTSNSSGMRKLSSSPHLLGIFEVFLKTLIFIHVIYNIGMFRKPKKVQVTHSPKLSTRFMHTKVR
jgi:hypothetical protein